MADQESIIEVDSLVANEFEVEINGEVATGIFRVAGFTSYKLDAGDDSVLITKMVQRDAKNAFNAWLREAEQSGQNARRDVSIVAIDDGVETHRWNLKNAWIISVSYSDFDSSSVEMIEECITVGYSGVEHKWMDD